MFFHVGVLSNVLTLVVATMAVGVSIMPKNPTATATTTSSPKKTTKPFSVLFRAEPDFPRKKDMRPRKLNRLIGTDYNEMWMSKTPMITATAVNGNKTGSAPWDRPVSPNELSLPEQLPAQYHQMLRAWLTLRTTCPVEFAWMDLGKSFWPRWIKQGRCGRTATISCSWPPGMLCMPSSVRVLSILRWHCWLKNRKNKRKNHGQKFIDAAANKTIEFVDDHGRSDRGGKKKKDKFRCMWIKVPYPVTEDCTCSCRKLEN